MIKKTAYLSPAHQEADRLLAEINDAQLIMAHTEEDLAAELARLQESSSSWTNLVEIQTLNQERLVRADQALKALEKEHKIAFFGDLPSCRITLPQGVLKYDLTHPVKRAKIVTPERLEELGFPSAVRIAKSVDWDLLESWSDEKLLFVGTERKRREVFGYEAADVGK